MRRLTLYILIVILIIAAVLSYFYFQRKENTDFLILYGNVDVRQVDLGFRVSGRVQTMNFEEGDFVEKGVLMGTLDKQPYTDLVREAMANVESSKVSLVNAEKVFKRRKDLIKDGSVSQEDFDNSLSTRDVSEAALKVSKAALGVALTNLRDTEVFAPTEGTILTRIREPGTVVREGDPIYTLSISSPVWVRAYIAEPFLGLIYPGMLAEVYTDTKGVPAFKGHIGFISPVAEFTPKTVETTQLRTDLVYRLRVIVDNPGRQLRQGMPVTVKLFTRQEPKKNDDKEINKK